jgi:hypothetical protein
MVRPIALAFSLLALSSGCTGSTGGELFEITGYAVGVDAQGGPYGFTNGLGYAVVLDRAQVHVGAMYLNQSVATSVSSDTSCTLAGIYSAELPSGLDVDVLSAEPQRFPGVGVATTDRARTGEVWLTGGDINDERDSTIVLDVAGIASRHGVDFPFEGRLTISDNRLVPPANPALPGAKPICKQRVVSPIPVNLVPEPGESLILHVDPAGMFANVDFSTLDLQSDGVYRFADSAENQASSNLFQGLRASGGVYSFSWQRMPSNPR